MQIGSKLFSNGLNFIGKKITRATNWLGHKIIKGGAHLREVGHELGYSPEHPFHGHAQRVSEYGKKIENFGVNLVGLSDPRFNYINPRDRY